jgi:dUTP pyrophosphatase
MSLSIKIKRIDKSLPLPKYQTQGSVGFDLYSRKQLTIEPGKIELIPTNLVVKVPQGYMLTLVSRSSTPRKKGLSKPHAIGIIDQDYCGDNDELLIQMYNFTSQPVQVDKLDRIAQGIFVPVLKPDFLEVDSLETNSRGGFGSTGQKAS